MNTTPRPRRRFAALLALGAGAVLALTPALSASAHVGATASSTAAGSFSIITFAVPHGCDGSPTVKLSIDIPASIPSVTPTVNPNWTVEKVMVPLDHPITDAHGGSITDRVGSVVYTVIGSGLPDGYRDTFALSLQLPDGKPGDVVEFPTLQTCAQGSVEWTGDEVPSVVLTAAVPGGGDDDHPAAPADGHPTAADPNGVDTLARVFGIAGLAVGVAGIVIAVIRRRPASD